MSDFAIKDMLQCSRPYRKNTRTNGKRSAPKPVSINCCGCLVKSEKSLTSLRKNGDKKAIEDSAVRQQLVEEMADVLMYYNDVLLCYGIREQELKKTYIAKFEKNMTRW